MTTINSATSSQINQNQTSAAQQTNSVVKTQTAASNSTEKTVTGEQVEISTRAQKIQQLNEEFFSGGIQSFSITPEFIQRLEEFGFITPEEAQKLGAKAVTNESEDGTATVGELSKFIDDFTASVKKVDPNNSLIDILQQAKTVLDDFNNPTDNSKNINVVQISKQIQSYIDSSTESLPKADQNALNQLVAALDIVSVLTPGKNTTSEIDSYLAINDL